MPNPLFNALGGNRPGPMPQGMQQMLSAFRQFRGAFQGDPQAQVKALMDSGRMTQEQYNQLAQMAQNLMQFLR